MHSTMDRRLPQYYGLMYEEGSWWDPNVDWSKPRPGPLDQWGRISYWHPAWGGFSDEQTFEAVKKSNAYYSWIKSSNHPRGELPIFEPYYSRVKEEFKAEAARISADRKANPAKHERILTTKQHRARQAKERRQKWAQIRAHRKRMELEAGNLQNNRKK